MNKIRITGNRLQRWLHRRRNGVSVYLMDADYSNDLPLKTPLRLLKPLKTGHHSASQSNEQMNGQKTVEY